MWRDLPENIALRWDNLDRLIAGIGLVFFGLLTFFAALVNLLAGRRAGDVETFIRQHGFDAIAWTFLGVVVLVALLLGFPDRGSRAWLLVAVLGVGTVVMISLTGMSFGMIFHPFYVH
ncbi:MAG: hypothetical protein AAGB29_00310 [Planctomycetota bacterium]